jgi:tetratricopeptide (TPR) repeat protein
MTATPMKTIILDIIQQGHDDEAAWEQERTETERAAIGTPRLWSARDHLVHRTFGRQNLVQVVTAILQRQAVPSREKINDEVNGEAFAAQRLRPWSELHMESEQVYADIISLIEQLGEDDLMDTQRFTAAFWNAGGRPLYAAFLGYWYEHGQEHITQYYSDRNDLPRAMQIREQCANRILHVELPEWVKGWFLYNLAGFYAQQHQLKQAAVRLQEAVAHNPRLQEVAKSDPDMAALHDRLT